MHCWSCGKELEDPESGKLSIRAECDFCMASLHSCVNCQNYEPGRANDCKVPGTEPIRDREASNFCDEFELLGVAPEDTSQKKNDALDKFNNLFGDS